MIVDRSKAKHARIEARMRRLETDFPAQTSKVELECRVLTAQHNELRETVHGLVEGFEQHEQQLAEQGGRWNSVA